MNQTLKTGTFPFNTVWQLSLFSFILAAVTGSLYRYGMLYPLPEYLSFANLRHAHSHLMFFNWVCPPLMAWMAAAIVQQKDDVAIRSFRQCLYVMVFLGFLSWPFFLLYGYHSVAIGPVNLPLAAIISGLVMISWYWFVWLYFTYKKHIRASLSLTFFDSALVALIVSSLGAWGVSVFQFSSINNPLLASALTHFFLSVFTEGWAVLGVLGLIWQKFDTAGIPVNTGWLWKPILAGSMLIFPFSLAQTLVPPLMLYTAKTGLVLIVAALGLNLLLFIRETKKPGFIFGTILALLGIKILFQSIAILPLDIWPGEHGLRVLYLHILLLGIVSITLVEFFQFRSGIAWRSFFTVSVLLVLASLAMVSGYWPQSLTPPHPYKLVLIAAVVPVIPATGLWIQTFKKSR